LTYQAIFVPGGFVPDYGSTDRVRRTAAKLYIEPARRRGDKIVKIHSGVFAKSLVDQKVLPPNRFPIICNALKSAKFLKENHLTSLEIQGPPSGRSSTVTFIYRIEEHESVAMPAKSELGGLLSLYGIFRGYNEPGGSEAFMKRQRDEFEREIL
jgi:hypothetical protein